jgi:diaminopimelate epimerase
MLLENEPGFDFKMVYYNADGNEGSMCGNGGRCIVAFAKHLGIITDMTKFLATDGVHHAKISEAGNWVSLQMIDVADINNDGEAYVLNTGSPHYVALTTDLESKDVYNEGYAIRNNDTYKQDGINVNFVEKNGDGYFVRTFERGVENETYACGTGVTAVALAMAKHDHQTGTITTPIKVLGGNLNIRFDYDGETFSNIFLEGPAELVFEGEIHL